jgi:hypothetical protein
MLVDMNRPCDAAYKRLVLLKCYDALEAVGFTRFRKEGVDWPLQEGFHSWVGLNTGLSDDYVEINPFVGLHVVPIMRMYTSLEGRKYDRGVATYARHMGELAPEEPAFHFTRQTDVEAGAARLARLYAGAGSTYAKSIADYEQLLPLLQERIGMLGAYPERTAACLYLMGRKEEARTFVADFLRENHDYFAGFVGPFLSEVAHHIVAQGLKDEFLGRLPQIARGFQDRRRRSRKRSETTGLVSPGRGFSAQ